MSGSDGVFNIAKGKIGYYIGLPAANDSLIAVLLKSAGLEADSALADHDTLAALLAGASDEADFTNYARQTLTTAAWTVDDTNDRGDGDADDITFTNAGGISNNTLAKLIICYKPDTGSADSAIIPLTYHTYDETTTGTTLLITVPSGGFARAA